MTESARSAGDAAWEVYTDVRTQVGRMLDSWPVAGPEHEQWHERLGFLLDATPAIIERLREHTHVFSGVCEWEYRRASQPVQRSLQARLAKLRGARNDEIGVAEPRILGGFGVDVDGELHNADTLTAFEALLALRAGELLDPSAAGGTPVVCQLGPAWGGFAYHLRRAIPGVQLVLVDRPESFACSATYLLSALPQLRAQFVTEPGHLRFDDADVTFVPYAALAAGPLPRVDVAVALNVLDQLSAAELDSAVDAVHATGSPMAYTMVHRDASPQAVERALVALSRRFWLSGLPPLFGKHDETDHQHLAGRRRVIT